MKVNVIIYCSHLLDINQVHIDIDDTEEHFGNPVNAFRTISRFTSTWKHEILDVLLDNSTYSTYVNGVANEINRKKLEVPLNEHLLGASDNLLELQESEGLTTSELANEEVLRDENSGKSVILSASDCYVFGRNLNQLQHYEYAAQWLLQAQQRAAQEAPTFPNVSKTRILEELSLAYRKLDNIKLANKLNNEILKLEPTNEAALNNKILLQKELILERITMSKLNEDGLRYEC